MIIRFLGTHHEESRDTRLVSFLIDDVLAVDAGSLSSELSFTEQKRIKAILLSHEHYDHIKDVPSFIFNNLNRTTKIFATSRTLKILASHLFDGIIYPNFTENNSFLEKPPVKLIALEHYNPVDIEGYQVLALPANHTKGSVGFEIDSKDGKKIFFTGDTGPGLSDIWNYISPQLIIIDLTFPNHLENTAKNAGHLCPKMLEMELMKFHQIKGYFPQVILIHLSPKHEKEIKREVKEVAKKLKISIDIACEGEKLTI